MLQAYFRIGHGPYLRRPSLFVACNRLTYRFDMRYFNDLSEKIKATISECFGTDRLRHNYLRLRSVIFILMQLKGTGSSFPVMKVTQ
jgi:hypothetical protein